jgi:hypothetical protein
MLFDIEVIDLNGPALLIDAQDGRDPNFPVKLPAEQGVK